MSKQLKHFQEVLCLRMLVRVTADVTEDTWRSLQRKIEREVAMGVSRAGKAAVAAL